MMRSIGTKLAAAATSVAASGRRRLATIDSSAPQQALQKGLAQGKGLFEHWRPIDSLFTVGGLGAGFWLWRRDDKAEFDVQQLRAYTREKLDMVESRAKQTEFKLEELKSKVGGGGAAVATRIPASAPPAEKPPL